MKKLLRKEFLLTACPLTWFFLAFSAMTMIPGYPILIGAFFICLGILYTFQFAREFNDTLYTALLPICKRDVVKAKYIFCIAVQLIALVINTALTSVRLLFFTNAAPYVNNPLMNANLAYLGYVLIVFACFNLFFLFGYFKTACYFGKPFLVFCIAAFLVVGITETLHHLPGLSLLNSTSLEGWPLQGAILVVGVVLYGLVTWTSFRKSVQRFEHIDL